MHIKQSDQLLEARWTDQLRTMNQHE